MADPVEQNNQKPERHEAPQPERQQSDTATTKGFDDVYSSRNDKSRLEDDKSRNGLGDNGTQKKDGDLSSTGQDAALGLQQIFERNRDNAFASGEARTESALGPDGKPLPVDTSVASSEYFDPTQREDGLKQLTKTGVTSDNETKSTFEGRKDGLLEDKTRVALGVEEHQQTFDGEIRADGKLSSHSVKTADGKVDLSLEKYDSARSLNGLLQETVSKENGVSTTTKAFDKHPQGLITEQTIADKSNSQTIQQYSDGRRIESYSNADGTNATTREFDSNGNLVPPKEGLSAPGEDRNGRKDQARSADGQDGKTATALGVGKEVGEQPVKRPEDYRAEGKTLVESIGIGKIGSDDPGKFQNADKLNPDGTIQQYKFENGTTITQFAGEKKGPLGSSAVLQEQGKPAEFYADNGTKLGVALGHQPLDVAQIKTADGKVNARQSDGSDKPSTMENYIKFNETETPGAKVRTMEQRMDPSLDGKPKAQAVDSPSVRTLEQRSPADSIQTADQVVADGKKPVPQVDTALGKSVETKLPKDSVQTADQVNKLPEQASKTSDPKSLEQSNKVTDQKSKTSDQPGTADEKSHLEQFRKGLEDGNFKLPPLKKGWGPYQALKHASEQNGLKLSPKELREESRRIRDREFAETGKKHFSVGEQLQFRSPKEIDKAVEAEKVKFNAGTDNGGTPKSDATKEAPREIPKETPKDRPNDAPKDPKDAPRPPSEAETGRKKEPPAEGGPSPAEKERKSPEARQRKPNSTEGERQPSAEKQLRPGQEQQKVQTPEELQRAGFAEQKDTDGKKTWVREGQDGSRTTLDEKGRLQEQRDANGRTFKFGQNEKGEINRIERSENNKPSEVWTRKDNQQLFEREGSKPPQRSAFQVADNGTITQTQVDKKGQVDKVSYHLTNGATISKDAKGLEIQTANGQNIRLDVNEKGQGTQLTIDGKSWQSQDGKTFSDGKETFKASLLPNGALRRDFTERTPPGTEVITTEGKTLKFDDKGRPARPPADRAVLEKGVDTIEKAIKAGGGTPDMNTLKQQLEGRSPEELKSINDIYKQKYGNGEKDLQDRLKEGLKGSDLEQANGLLTGRNDDATDFRVQLQRNAEKIGRGEGPDKEAQQKLIETLKTKSSTEIAKIDKDYQERYGTSLRDAFSKDPNLSDTTKQFLDVYSKGADQRAKNPQDVLKLADLATNAKDLNLFKTVFADAAVSPELRDQYLKNGGEDKIAKAFGPWVYGTTLEQRQALDFVKNGKVSADTTVDSHRSWLGDNEKAIEHTLKSMTPEERKSYLDGKKLSQGDTTKLDDNQKRDLEYYQKVHGALDRAAGFLTDNSKAKELAKWEDLITNPGGTGFINKLSEHFGSVYNDGAYKVIDTIEGIDKNQWERLKNDPVHRKEVYDLLKKNYGDQDYKRITDVLDRKLNAKSFDDSKEERRSVVDSINDRKGTLTNDHDGIIRALEGMTKAEQEEFRKPDSELRKNLLKAVDSGVWSGHAREAAKEILQGIDKGEAPKAGILTQLHSASREWIGDTGKVVSDVEKAFRDDPKLRERLLDPKTDGDRDFAKKFNETLRTALGADAFDKYGRKLIENGSLSITDKADIYKKTNSDTALDRLLGVTAVLSPVVAIGGQLLRGPGGDPKGFIDSLKTAKPEDLKQIENGSAKGLEFLSRDQRTLAEQIAKQQGKTSPEDELRLAVVTGDSKAAKEIFAKLTPEKSAELKDSYTKKYDSDLVEDTKNLLSGDDKRQALSVLREPPKDAAEAFRRAREDRYDSATGFGKWFTDNFWDGTGEQVVNDYSELGRQITDYSRQLKEIPPEQLKEFDTKLQESLKLFRESKTAAADAVIDGLIITAGVGGSVFTGGVSLGLLATTGLAGGLLKVGFKAAVEGKDYDTSLGNILKDGSTGAFDAATSFLGPAQLALLKGLGKASATTAAKTVVTQAEDLAKVGGRQLLKDGSGEALEKGLQQRLAVAIGNGEKEITPKSIQELAKEVATSPEAAKELEKLITDGLGKALKQETSTLLKGLGREITLNTTAGGISGVLNGTVEGIADWDSSKNFLQNLEHLGSSIGTKVALNAGTAGLATPVFRTAARAAQETTKGVTTTYKSIRDLVDAPKHPRGETPRLDVSGEPIAHQTPGRQPVQGDDIKLARPDNAKPDRGRLVSPDDVKRAKPEDPQPRLRDVEEPPAVRDRTPDRAADRPIVHVKPDEFEGRDFTVDGKNYKLSRELGGWRYGKHAKSGLDPSDIKVHVNTHNAEDLRRLQEVLIPELNNNPRLRELVNAWKTQDPLGLDHLKPARDGQEAKAFTIYVRSEGDAHEIQKILDQTLAKKGLRLDERLDTNVDHVFGDSNRVGIVREKFHLTHDQNGRPAARLDNDLSSAIHQRYGVPEGQQLSSSQLREIERNSGLQKGLLIYDRENKLSLATTKPGSSPIKEHPGKLYLTESGVDKLGPKTDRPAYYALSRDFGIDPADRYAKLWV